MTFASLEDRNALDQEMPWAERDVAKTMYQFLTRTRDRFPDRPAVSYQLTSGPKDKAETLTWDELHKMTVQAANMFRALGIEENDTIAYVLPNAHETLVTLLGGMIAGIANPINPLLEPEQIASILRETNAKVVVTLKAFPKTDVPQKVAEAVRNAPGVHTVLEIDLLRYLTPPKSWIVPLIRPKNKGEHHAKGWISARNSSSTTQRSILKTARVIALGPISTPAVQRACQRLRNTAMRAWSITVGSAIRCSSPSRTISCARCLCSMCLPFR